MFNRYLFIIAFLLMPLVGQCDIYKYKDENGKWVFSDRPPPGKGEKVELKYDQPKSSVNPELFIYQENGTYNIKVENPFYAPLDIKVYSDDFDGGFKRFLVAPMDTSVVYKSETKFASGKYRWSLGDPKAVQDGYVYNYPVSSNIKRQISQAFHGRFSHSHQPNLYAVDIALPIGTNIIAARGGIVAMVKDTYSVGGVDNYFLDKANMVMIFHDDGTYAIYAHILMGSAKVKPGQRVKEGQLIAQSGSTGYSSGPHLHFVVLKNTDEQLVSVPFKFKTKNGTVFVPQAGMML